MRKLIRQLPAMFFWLAVSCVIWGWIFALITDTSYDKKLTVAADAYIKDETALAVKLEEYLPDNLKMVKVYPFTYAMMSSTPLEHADIVIMPESACEEYSFLTDEAYEGRECTGSMTTFIDYYPDGEAFYIFVGKNSAHPLIALDYIDIMLGID